jgi:hypothetical protein
MLQYPVWSYGVPPKPGSTGIGLVFPTTTVPLTGTVLPTFTVPFTGTVPPTLTVPLTGTACDAPAFITLTGWE